LSATSTGSSSLQYLSTFFITIFLVANGNPIIAIFQTKVAHVILRLMIFIKGGSAHESITFILFLSSCKIISIVLLKLNSNQMCFLFLDYYENGEGGLAFGIHSE